MRRNKVDKCIKNLIEGVSTEFPEHKVGETYVELKKDFKKLLANRYESLKELDEELLKTRSHKSYLENVKTFDVRVIFVINAWAIMVISIIALFTGSAKDVQECIAMIGSLVVTIPVMYIIIKAKINYEEHFIIGDVPYNEFRAMCLQEVIEEKGYR